MKRLATLAAIALLGGCAGTGTHFDPPPEESPKWIQYALDPKKKPAVEVIVICSPRQYDCQQFSKDIPEEYDQRPVSYYAPLVEMDITKPAPSAWYQRALERQQLRGNVVKTPTAILWEGTREGGRELARYIGYDGKKEFYNQVRAFVYMYDLKDGHKRNTHY